MKLPQSWDLNLEIPLTFFAYDARSFTDYRKCVHVNHCVFTQIYFTVNMLVMSKFHYFELLEKMDNNMEILSQKTDGLTSLLTRV